MNNIPPSAKMALYLLQFVYNRDDRTEVCFRQDIQQLMDAYVHNNYQSNEQNILLVNAVLWSVIPKNISELWLYYCHRYSLVILVQTADKIWQYSSHNEQAVTVHRADVCRKYGLDLLWQPAKNPLWQASGTDRTILHKNSNIDDIYLPETDRDTCDDNRRIRVVFLRCPTHIKAVLDYDKMSQKSQPQTWLSHHEVIAAHYRCQSPVIYVNALGSSDGFVYAGEVGQTQGSDTTIQRLKAPEVSQSGSNTVAFYNQILLLAQYQPSSHEISWLSATQRPSQDWHDVYYALMLSLRQFMRNAGFAGCIVGLSGGIDSSLVTTLAVDALGAENVFALFLPGKHTYAQSHSCVDSLVSKLQCKGIKWHIDDIYRAVTELLDLSRVDAQPMTRDTAGFGNDIHSFRPSDVNSAIKDTIQNHGLDLLEEWMCIYDKFAHSTTDIHNDYNANLALANLQTRIRTLLLLAQANLKYSPLLSCSNKSEHLVGYHTIFGDGCGMFAPLIDLYKTDVYALAAWRNKNIPRDSLLPIQNPIAAEIIGRPPSAELYSNHLDSHDLPPYNVLDTVLWFLQEMDYASKQLQHLYVYSRADEEIMSDLFQVFGFETVNRVTRLMANNWFKRRFTPPGTHFY